MTNPFLHTIVVDPWSPVQSDVAEIHGNAFRLCCQAFEDVKRGKGSTSVILHGEAGSGKTHLLARLRLYLKKNAAFHLFVSVRLDCSPHRFWRHIRKCLIENLLRQGRGGRTQLELVFLGRLYFLCKKKRITLSEFHALLEQLSFEADLSRNLCKALEHLVWKRHRMEAVAWLKGESLPESALDRMDLAPEEETAEDPEYEARSMIHQICRLAGPRIPVVLCFDQVEALKRYPRDTGGLFVFGQGVGFLHDNTSNVLLVSCIQTYFFQELEDAVSGPDYARLIRRRGTLNPLLPDQALKLVSMRLVPPPEIAEEREGIFNILKKDLKGSVGPQGETARKILSRCADLFDSWRSGLPDVPRVKVKSDEEFLVAEKTRREEETLKAFTPEGTDEIIQAGLPVILNILDDRWKEQDRDRPRDIDLILESAGSKVGVSLCNHKNMTSLAGRLRRLGNQIKASGLDRVILVRHPMIPISQGAKKTKKYLEDLKGHNARMIQPSTETLAALEALRSLLADAKAGDLANHGNAVGEGTVRDWLKGHLSGPLADFLQEMVTPQVTLPEPAFLHDLLDLIERDKLVVVDTRLARALGTDLNSLEAALRRYPHQLGYLGGPPPVAFQFIPESADTY